MVDTYRKTKVACYIGYVVQAIINNYLPILFIIFEKNYSLSYEKLGRIIFINFFVQIFADLLTPLIAKRIGYKGTAVLCHAITAMGFCLLSILPKIMDNTYLAILISVSLCAVGSGIIEVVISPIVELLPTENKGANMAFLHSFYCWGQAFTVIVTTALVYLFGYMNWQYVPLVWAVVPLLNMLFFERVKVIEPDKNEKVPTAREMLLTREFFCFVIFMVCAGASEIAMADWTSFFAQTRLGVSKVVGDLLGPCAFAIFMGTGRIVYGAFSGKYSARKVLILNNLLCLLCYVGVALFENPVFSLVACALCGFSVSLSWPSTLSLAAARFKNGGTVMFSLFALSGDFGCSTGPWLLGFIADNFGFKWGFLACAVFPLIFILAALFLIKEKDCKVN